MFAFGAALLGMPAAAQAVALVSNVQQPNTKYWTQVVGETAQGFRTGSNTGGYTLESIEIDFLGVWDGSNLRVTLWSATSGQRPAAFLATLTNPSDLLVNSGSNVKRFTAPPFTNLNADTMYFVRLSVSGSSRVVLDALETTGEDAGRAAGWSINNFVLQRSNGSTADWRHPEEGIVRIRVNGTAGTTTNPNPPCAAPNLAGREQIWTGELTVEAAIDFGITVYHGYDSSTSLTVNAGALDNLTFNIGRKSYTIPAVYVFKGGIFDGGLRFVADGSILTDEERAALRLHVCDTPYDFSAAANRLNTYYWAR